MIEKDRDQKDAYDRIRKYYDEDYYGLVPSEQPLSWHEKLVASRISIHPGLRVLDVACGTGRWLGELQDRGAEVAGIDISSRAISIARENLPEARLEVSVAEELPFRSDEFDLVTCLGSLEHFVDQRKCLQEMTRVSKADARILILVPHSGFLTRRLGLYAGTNQTKAKETVRSLAEWRAMLREAGLIPIKQWRDLHMLSFGWLRKAPLYQQPIRLLQSVALAVWPISWQYQVYFLCEKKVY